MERLPWKRSSETEFIAHPEGEGSKPYARVWFDSVRPAQGQWGWAVRWPGWFEASGRAGDAKIASSDATSAWYTLRATPIPRDVDGEIAAIMAVIETEPLRDDLLAEEYAFLLSLMNTIRTKYIGTMQYPPPPPERVRKVIAELSAEFYRRRAGGL